MLHNTWKMQSYFTNLTFNMTHIQEPARPVKTHINPVAEKRFSEL